MRYVEFQASAPLIPFVACIWILEGSAAPDAGPQPVFPDGRAELIIHYADPFSRRFDSGPEQQSRGLLVGQITRALHLQEGPSVGVIAARLSPAGVGALLGDSASEITGREVEISALAGSNGRQLVEQIQSRCSDRERVATLERFLLSRFDPASPPDPRVETAVRVIQRTGGTARIDELARWVALSSRQLHRRFLETVGLAPKTYARIVRLQRALDALGAGHSITRTAVECGYHDHAHFTREFSQFAGIPPSRFLRSTSTLSGHFIEKASDSYKTTFGSAL